MSEWGSNRERKRIAREFKKRIARRDECRAKVSRLQGRGDIPGLTELMGRMWVDSASPALMLEAGQAVVSCGAQAQQEAINLLARWDHLAFEASIGGKRLSPSEHAMWYTGGLLIALCGSSAWPNFYEHWDVTFPQHRGRYLCALACFEVLCEEVRLEAARLLDAFPDTRSVEVAREYSRTFLEPDTAEAEETALRFYELGL